MGFQLLYWSYLQDIKHPVLTLLDSSPASFVGEDIELSLSLLSNYTSTTNLARETDPLHEAYQKLNLLMHIAHKVRDYRISHFGGASQRRARLFFTADSPEAEKVKEFVLQ